MQSGQLLDVCLSLGHQAIVEHGIALTAEARGQEGEETCKQVEQDQDEGYTLHKKLPMDRICEKSRPFDLKRRLQLSTNRL
ncbi:hypothetical protein DSECCO2_496230 [anaerobic digester metagenome]